MTKSTKQGIFIIVILGLIAIGSIIMFINIVYYGTTHSVEAKIKQEFYKDETIMSEYDEIITYKIEQIYSWQPDEELPKDVESGCFKIHILAISGNIVIEQDYLCVVFYKVKLDILRLHRDEILLDCDFVKIQKEV